MGATTSRRSASGWQRRSRPPPLTERQRRRIAAAIVREARLNGVDPLLVVAVIRTESSFRIHAVSCAGAVGLMQVVPATARERLEARGEPVRSERLFDPELNIALGTSYLASLLRRFTSLEKALLAYNVGPTGAVRLLSDPDRRRQALAGYPRRVLEQLARLKALHPEKASTVG